MKQSIDKKTFELDLTGGKRSRGRPPKADALTPAERAKRYRDSQRLKKLQAPGEPVMVSAEQHMRLKRMYWNLEDRVRVAQEERDKLKAMLNASH